MKKTLKRFLLIALAVVMLLPSSAYAAEEEAFEKWQDTTFTQEEIEEFSSLNPESQIMPLATGLILNNYVTASVKSGKLGIYAVTNCASTVKKCGYKEVLIQRRKKGAVAFGDYYVYKSLYKEGTSYTLSKTQSVPSGYQYRVICTHYAKKNLFSTEKKVSTSNIVYI